MAVPDEAPLVTDLRRGFRKGQRSGNQRLRNASSSPPSTNFISSQLLHNWTSRFNHTTIDAKQTTSRVGSRLADNMNEGTPLKELETPNLNFFPFTKLPPDIQYNVVQSLCGHCGKEDDPVAVFYHSTSEQTKTLMSLCLVSREMRSLAQNILYHYPRVYSYTSFFRTLQLRPELADSVKVQTKVYDDILWRRAEDDSGDQGYDNVQDGNQGSEDGRGNGRERVSEKDNGNDKGSDLYREDFSYLMGLVAELKLDNTEVAEFEEIFRHYPSKHAQDFTGVASAELYRVFDNLATCIIMVLCKRLEFLTVNLRDKEYRFMRDSNKWPTKYPFLPGLVKHTPEGEGLRYVHTLVLRNTRHLNSHMLGLDRASPLWLLLPNVKRLVLFYSIASYESSVLRGWTTEYEPKDEPQPEYLWEALPHLKELRFVRYGWGPVDLPYIAIERMVSRCTELEKLTFSPALLYEWPFRPSKLLHAISSCAPTLRHLAINCPIPEAAYVDSTCLLGADLKQFTSIESLVLDQAVFCHHHHDPDSAAGAACLTNILPDNLQALTVNIHAWLSPVIDIIALGDAKARGGFPKLRYLRIQMTFEDKCWPHSDPPPKPSSRSPSPCHMTWAPSEGLPDEVNLPLMEPRKRRQKQVLDAFKGTNVNVQMDFFRRRRHNTCIYDEIAAPLSGTCADTKLIDRAE